MKTTEKRKKKIKMIPALSFTEKEFANLETYFLFG